jgi:hypothetical protein
VLASQKYWAVVFPQFHTFSHFRASDSTRNAHFNWTQVWSAEVHSRVRPMRASEIIASRRAGTTDRPCGKREFLVENAKNPQWIFLCIFRLCGKKIPHRLYFRTYKISNCRTQRTALDLGHVRKMPIVHSN